MRAGGDNALHIVAIEHFNVLHGLHLEKEFIPRPSGRIPRTTFFAAKDGKGNIRFIQEFHKSFGDFFCSIVKAAGAANPEKDIGFLAFC
jgi:hypothetical protein